MDHHLQSLQWHVSGESQLQSTQRVEVSALVQPEVTEMGAEDAIEAMAMGRHQDEELQEMPRATWRLRNSRSEIRTSLKTSCGFTESIHRLFPHKITRFAQKTPTSHVVVTPKVSEAAVLGHKLMAVGPSNSARPLTASFAVSVCVQQSKSNVAQCQQTCP